MVRVVQTLRDGAGLVVAGAVLCCVIAAALALVTVIAIAIGTMSVLRVLLPRRNRKPETRA